MEDSNELIVQKNWWERNWKWFVPTGCLSLIIIFAVFIASLFFGITSLLKSSDSYKIALDKAQHNKIVIEKLGSPIEDDGIASGSVNINNDVENCNFKIPIKGSKGTGILHVVGTKNGTWKFHEMNVYVKSSKENINLLK